MEETWGELDEIYNQKRYNEETDQTMKKKVAMRHSSFPIATGTIVTNIEDFPFLEDLKYVSLTSEPRHAQVVSRAHEEAYMVEARGIDACSRSSCCECYLMFGYTMRKFVTPDEEESGLCVLCIRIGVLQLYLDARANAVIPTRAIQPYRNMVGVEGEYSSADCICAHLRETPQRASDAGDHIIEPFVMHVRSKYDSIKVNGEWRVIQSGYGTSKKPFYVDFRNGRQML